jgi:thioredoxin-dependent peroxiredoxin
VIVLGASYDTVAANRAFAEKFHYPFRLLCDVDRSLGAAYGADDPSDPGYPRRISYLIGPDRRIVKSYDPVQVATHPAQVLADVDRRA